MDETKETDRKNSRYWQAVLCALLVWGATEALTGEFAPSQPLLPASTGPSPVAVLVIDLDGDGPELTPVEGSTAHFDLDRNGFAEQVGWVSPDDGLLALDRNGNGWIDDVYEVFGGMDGFADGLSRLRGLDATGDGILDAGDARFADLRAWRDLDQNGRSSAEELSTLPSLGTVSISLSPDVVGREVRPPVTRRAVATRFDLLQTGVEEVSLDRNPGSSFKLLDADFVYHDDARLLPVLWGSGNVASTWVVLSEDDALRARAFDLLDMLSTGNVDAFLAGFEDFALAWAGVTDVSAASRGPHVDGQHLAFLDTIYGRTFQQWNSRTGVWNSDPNDVAGQELEELYHEMMDRLAGRFIAQSATSGALLATRTRIPDVATTQAVASHPFGALSMLAADYRPEARQLAGSYAQALAALEAEVAKGTLGVGPAAKVARLLRFDLSGDGNPDDVLLSAMQEAGLSTTDPFGAAIISRSN